MLEYGRKILYFYLITVLFSWTLFIITDAWLIPKYAQTGFVMLIALYGHIAAMMGPMIGSVIMLRVFKGKSLLSVHSGYFIYYLYTFYAVLIIWIIPGLFFLMFDKSLKIKTVYSEYDIFFIISYLFFGWFAGMGEEFGWSGYILRELSDKIGKSKAVVVSGILRGLWHLPLLLIPVVLKVISGKQSFLELLLLSILFAFQLVVSNIFMSALWGYVWFETKSIPLLGWMHFLFDLGRDLSLLCISGFGGSFWFKFGWAIPFLSFAYMAFQKIAVAEGYSSYLAIFRKRRKLA
jgi:uncharacterized protein